MNQKDHPASVRPSRAGHSIGRWEGDVLVVDTARFLPGVLNAPVRHGDKLHVVERFTLDPQTTKLTRTYTATDPDYLKGEYTGQDMVEIADQPYAAGQLQGAGLHRLLEAGDSAGSYTETFATSPLSAGRARLTMNKSSIQNFVRNYSIETTVPQAQRVERFADLVPLGTCLYIAHIPGTDFKDTVALAARLRQEGMEPVPHVVGRRIESRAMLDDFLARLSGDAGVKQALVVAGDNSDPAGEYHERPAVLESGLLEQYGIGKIGVAGHPEGHREVADPVLRDALRRKNAYKEKTGAKVYMVTQFAFSADPVLAWEASHRDDIGTAAGHRRPARAWPRRRRCSNTPWIAAWARRCRRSPSATPA